MAQKNKALEKEIKATIKALNKQTGAKLSYTSLYEDIESALQPHMSASRDEELIRIYTQGISALSNKPLERHSIIVSNPILREKYKGDPAEKYTITMASTQMNDLMMKMLELQNPDFAKGFVWNEQQLNTVRDYEQGALRDRSLYNEWPKCLKEWNHICFRHDIEKIDKTFNSAELSNNQYKYDKKRGNEMDVKVAELFYKAKLIKEEIDGYGFFTGLFNRIFNYKKMNAYSDFLAKADETLTKVGFVPNRDESSAYTLLYKKIMPPHETDMKYIESEREERNVENEKKIQEIQNKDILEYGNNLTEQQIKDHIAYIKQDADIYMQGQIDQYNKEHGTHLSVSGEINHNDQSKSTSKNQINGR